MLSKINPHNNYPIAQSGKITVTTRNSDDKLSVDYFESTKSAQPTEGKNKLTKNQKYMVMGGVALGAAGLVFHKKIGSFLKNMKNDFKKEPKTLQDKLSASKSDKRSRKDIAGDAIDTALDGFSIKDIMGNSSKGGFDDILGGMDNIFDIF